MFLKRCLAVTVALTLLTLTNCEGSDEYIDLFEGVTPAPAVSDIDDITSLRAKVAGNLGCGASMKCVAYYLCSENGDVVTDGSFLIDERLDADLPKEDRPSCPAMEYCCETNNHLKIPEIKNKCNTYKAPAKCGFRNVNGLSDPVKSIQGISQYAHYAEFPWLMAVSNETNFLGGGALIHPQVVLTAAHILKHSKASKIKVRGGEYNTKSEEEICSQVEKTRSKVIIHEGFNADNLQNNIALIITQTPFKLSATINTVCLPPADMVFDRKKCVSSGWGKTNFDALERHQAFPKVVNLPVVPHETCQTMFRNTRLGEDFKLDSGFLCAGGEKGIDVCTGDGGSPLVCESNHKGHYFVAGIVAGGLSCGQENIPGFYSKVSHFRGWIDQQLGALGFPGATLT